MSTLCGEPLPLDLLCEKEAVVAIRTTHGGRDTAGLKTTIWSDLEDAPKTASTYCTFHGGELAKSLILTLCGNR